MVTNEHSSDWDLWWTMGSHQGHKLCKYMHAYDINLVLSTYIVQIIIYIFYEPIKWSQIIEFTVVQVPKPGPGTPCPAQVKRSNVQDMWHIRHTCYSAPLNNLSNKNLKLNTCTCQISFATLYRLLGVIV